MSGMEVEELRPVAPPFANIVVAEIVEAEPHPNADKLRVCRVDAGKHSKDGPLQIVCGAPNARVGIRVPLALVGAELPPGEDGKPFKIGVGKLRGVESFGMLCSARELKLSDDHGGLLELAADAPLGEDVRKTLALDDHLITLKLTPNLGHCLSVYGIARELSALTGAPLKTPAFPPVKTSHDDILPVRVEAKDLCGRFSGRIVRGVNPKAKTPQWMVDRLARCGQRSVTALVDISNYVMFEYGRPSHIFDLDKIDRELVVRWAKQGESLKLLNGNTVELDEQVGVIADAKAVESLAGIMGGDHTAVSDDTKNVYVEAAFWWPEAVMGRSRRYAFSTDAGHRFERGVDPVGTVEHIERITQLIIDICGGAGRADGRPAAGDAAAHAGDAARGACGQGHRHAADAGAVRGRDEAPRLRIHGRRGHDHRHAAVMAFRPDDRRRPDRRGDPRSRLRQAAGHAAAGARDGARAARVAAQRACAAPRSGRARLPGDDRLQLCRRALGARAGRQRRSDPRAEPDRRAAGRDALEPDRQPGGHAAPQPRPACAAGAHLRSRPRVPAQCGGRRW